MRWLVPLVVVVLSPTMALGQYTFGDWARDQGYAAGDAMPGEVWALRAGIDSLDGIGDFDWTTTPTNLLRLDGNQISSIESGHFSGLMNLTELSLWGNQISSIETGDFDGLTNLTELSLGSNQISSIESGAFSGIGAVGMLYLYDNVVLTELNLAKAEFSRRGRFWVNGNVNITSVSLKNTVVNQRSLAVLLDGGDTNGIGIGELDGITEMDLSGIDFANITDLEPLYVMDDLTDLWMVNTDNVDATDLDRLLDNLETIEGIDTEGVLYMTQADFDAFNAAGGGLLAAWDAEPGHHVAFVIPEPSTLVLAIVALGSFIGWRRWGYTTGTPSLVALLLSLLTTAFIPPAAADIYRWDNGDLITEKDAEPGVQLRSMDLSYADLAGALLRDASFRNSNLTYAHLMNAGLSDADFSQATLIIADLSGANLTDASFEWAKLYSTDFTGAVVRGSDFTGVAMPGFGFTADQFYSTASYQSSDLTGIGLGSNDLTGWDFAGKNLTDVSFRLATLTNAGLSGTNLTDASLWGATLTATNFTGAVVRGTRFSRTTTRGFTADQFYSTASYQSGDLTGIGLSDNDLSGWDFAGKNLTDASFRHALLIDADLSGTNLTDASLWRAWLYSTNFTGAVVRGTRFSRTTTRGFTADQFYSTASYQSGDLTGIGLGSNDLTGWDFAGKNLTDVSFRSALLIDADFTGAVVRGSDFTDVTIPRFGFTADQFYSTASYQSGDLTGIGLGSNDLTGWDFAGKNLTDADFDYATLTGADLNRSDLRGAEISASQIAVAASTRGTILRDGRIEGLTLDAREQLVVRDDNGYSDEATSRDPIPITVESGMDLDRVATLSMVLEDADWASTISFEPAIDVALDGTLELTFADISPVSLIGTAFDLFNWDGVTPTGTFAEIVTEAEAVWDTSSLYTTGEVTLLFAVPEPSTLLLLALGVIGALRKWGV